jgi:hypothetical protein
LTRGSEPRIQTGPIMTSFHTDPITIKTFGWHSKLLDGTLTFERKKEQTAAAWDRVESPHACHGDVSTNSWLRVYSTPWLVLAPRLSLSIVLQTSRYPVLGPKMIFRRAYHYCSPTTMQAARLKIYIYLYAAGIENVFDAWSVTFS